MPDVDLARRDGVELVRVGSWALSTGHWNASPADLAAAVAASQCPAVRRPVLWIGHTDNRFTPRGGDGEPTIGWVENLRLADGGHTLLGDYVGVPAWLDQVMASAYPDRSVEGAYNRKCQLGHTHPFILDGVALLGVTRPGVGTLKSLQSLDDVRALYGLAASGNEDPQDGEVRISAHVTAAEQTEHTGAMIALIPRAEDAERLTVDGGEPIDELHTTLFFLGEAVELPPRFRAEIRDAVHRAVSGLPPVEGEGFALSAFNPPGVVSNDGKQRDTCIVLGVGGEDISDTHALVTSAVLDVAARYGVDLPSQHKPWTPHITLAYTDDLSRMPALADRAGTVIYDRVRIAFAGEHTDIPLTAADRADFGLPGPMLPVAAAGDGQLRDYWTRGAGAKLIRWGTDGDFKRCVRHLRKYVHDPEGLCNEYHQEALGAPPGKGHVHASKEDNPMPNPKPDVADRIKEAWNATAPVQQYIVQVRASDVIVMDDADRKTYCIPVTLDGDIVEFGERQPVALDYVPADTVAASVAVYASREESRPDAPSADPTPTPEPAAEPVTPDAPATDGGIPDPPAAEPDNAPSTDPKGEDHVSTLSTDVRSRLGLAAEDDDAAVLAALDGLKSKADQTAEQVAASTADRDEMKTEIVRLSTELADIKASAAADAKKALFDAAVKDGKLRPADRDGWEARYDRAPDVISEILASIAPNTAVPVAPVGETGSPETVDVDAEFAQFSHLFPPALTSKEG